MPVEASPGDRAAVMGAILDRALDAADSRRRRCRLGRAGGPGLAPEAALGERLELDRPRVLSPCRRNVLLLALCQATFMSSVALMALLHRHGWEAVVTTAVPLLGLALAAVLVGRWRGGPGAPEYHGPGRSPGEAPSSAAAPAAASGKGRS